MPISAKLVANVLSAAGTNRVLTMDLHKAQIQGFLTSVDHLFAAPVIIDYLSRLDSPNLTLVSPDAAAPSRPGLREAPRRRARHHRQTAERRWHCPEVMNVIGDVEGRVHHSGRHHRHGRDDHEGRDRVKDNGRRG